MNNYDYKRLCPFKWFILENFPFIEADFDALTNWQLFCKIGKEMNKIIKSVNKSGEQVENLTNAFIELQDYVNNYFENLDIQTEIDNKLDEMAEDGTLTEIIAEYLQLSSVLAFDNISSLKSAENLVNGSLVQTYGYYTKNDGGASKYLVRSVLNTDTPDDIKIIALHDNTLVAELVENSPISIRQCGAKGDGETDDTAAIQYAFDNFKNIYIPDGIYMIDATTHIIPTSNSKIQLSKNATLKAITNSNDSYSILYLLNVSNIIIEGGTIEGDRASHSGATGEWGQGISIINSTNILIKDMILKDCWGDGIYLYSGTNIKTQNIICDNNRRQGLSIISVNGYHSQNDTFQNTNGTSPSAGIDIEPNANTDIIKNIVIDNPRTINNDGTGIAIHLPRLTGSTNEVSIVINSHYDYQSQEGLRIAKPYDIIGNIVVNNSQYINSHINGINLRDCYNNDKFIVELNKPYILNYNIDELSPAYVAGIGGYTTEETTHRLGGVKIVEPFITSAVTGTNRRSITIYDPTNELGAENVQIINPVNKQSNLVIAFQYQGERIRFEDKNELYTQDINSTVNIQATNLLSKIYNSAFTSSRTYAFATTFPIGAEIEIINNNLNRFIGITIPENQYCRYFSENANPTIYLRHYNDRLKLKRVSATEWIVVNIMGQPGTT